MNFHRISILVAVACGVLCIAFVSGVTAAPVIYISQVGNASNDVNNIIRTADLGATTEIVATSAVVSEGIAFDTTTGKMYWTDRDYLYLRRAGLDGCNYEKLTDSSLLGLTKRGLALDGLGKIYYGNATPGEIRRVNLDGTGDTLFYSNAVTTDAVRRIKIAGDKLYWADSGSNTINSVNLDGTGATTLLDVSDVYGLAVDNDGGKIYWTEFRTTERIRRANLDGSNPETVLDLSGGVYNRISGLDYCEEKLYFGDWGTNTVSRINVDGSGLETLCSANGPIEVAVTPKPDWYPVANGRMVMDPVFKDVVVPWSTEHPRNDHQMIFPLDENRLMMAWTENYDPGTSDYAPSRMMSMISTDKGRTWGSKAVLQENLWAINVKHPNMTRLPSGEILFSFSAWESTSQRTIYMKRSQDNGETWSDLVNISGSGWYGNTADRAITLSTGRVLLPTCRRLEEDRYESLVWYSDDGFQTWETSEAMTTVSGLGATEPSIVELEDGRVLCFMRTDLGRVYKAYSEDGGAHWSQPEPTDLHAPASPTQVKRIPQTGDLVVLWNNEDQAVPGSHGLRSPLSAAISKDEGQTWTNYQDILVSPEVGSYTSIFFQDDEVIVMASGPNHADITEWIFKISEFYMPIPGDANDDGKVDAVDAAILASNWQKQGVTWAEGDFNDDGNVNDVDATLMAANWTGGGEAEVPEPAPICLILTALGSVAVIRFGLGRNYIEINKETR